MVTFDDISRIACVWINSISGCISTLCSSMIIYMILSSPDRVAKMRLPHIRFLIVMSSFDILQSLAFTASALPVPKSTGYYGAIGNDITCATQGFLFQLGAAVPFYNSCLCIWYLLSIKYSMRADTFAQKYERYCHAVSILFPVCTAILAGALGIYGSRGNLCWMTDENKVLNMFPTIMMGPVIFGTMLIIFYCNAAIYHSFIVKERVVRRYSTSSTGMQWRPNQTLQGKKDVARQALLYSLSFILSYLFIILAPFLPAKEHITAPGELDIPIAIFVPLQGFWNFIIFSNRKFTRIRNEYPELSNITVFLKMVFSPQDVPPLPRNRRPKMRRKKKAMKKNSLLHQNRSKQGMKAGISSGEHTDRFPATEQAGTSDEQDVEMEQVVYKTEEQDVEAGLSMIEDDIGYQVSLEDDVGHQCNQMIGIDELEYDETEQIIYKTEEQYVNSGLLALIKDKTEDDRVFFDNSK